jgi:hypothetical protein
MTSTTVPIATSIGTVDAGRARRQPTEFRDGFSSLCD